MASNVWAAAAACAWLAFALGACDAGDPSAPTATPTVPGSSSSAPARDYAGSDLNAALLTGSDLPADYAIDNQLRSGETVLSSCPEEALALDGYRRDAKASAATAYSNDSGQFVVQSLVLLSADTSTVTLGALKQAVSRCTTWTIDRATYTLTQKTLDTYGDESIGYRVSVADKVPFTFAVLFIRRANLLMAVQVGTVGTSPPGNATAVFDAANRKFAAL